jgi:hypothetical protein
MRPARLRPGGSSHSAMNWELQATNPTCGCYSATNVCAMLSTALPGGQSRAHPCLHARLCDPHSLVLSVALLRLSSHNLGLELGRHQRVFWFVHGCKRCAALGMCDHPVDDETRLLCPLLLPVRFERRISQLQDLTSLQDLMGCRGACGLVVTNMCHKVFGTATSANCEMLQLLF